MKIMVIVVILGLLGVSGCGDGNKVGGQLETGWYHVVDSGAGVERKLGDSLTCYLDPQPVVTAAHFKTVKTEALPHDSTHWQVVVQLDGRGRELFAKATEELIGKDLVFVLDDSLWSEPIRVQGKIPNGVMVISKRQFSKEDAEELRGRIDHR